MQTINDLIKKQFVGKTLVRVHDTNINQKITRVFFSDNLMGFVFENGTSISGIHPNCEIELVS